MMTRTSIISTNGSTAEVTIKMSNGSIVIEDWDVVEVDGVKCVTLPKDGVYAACEITLPHPIWLTL